VGGGGRGFKVFGEKEKAIPANRATEGGGGGMGGEGGGMCKKPCEVPVRRTKRLCPKKDSALRIVALVLSWRSVPADLPCLKAQGEGAVQGAAPPAERAG